MGGCGGIETVEDVVAVALRMFGGEISDGSPAILLKVARALRRECRVLLAILAMEDCVERCPNKCLGPMFPLSEDVLRLRDMISSKVTIRHVQCVPQDIAHTTRAWLTTALAPSTTTTAVATAAKAKKKTKKMVMQCKRKRGDYEDCDEYEEEEDGTIEPENKKQRRRRRFKRGRGGSSKYSYWHSRRQRRRYRHQSEEDDEDDFEDEYIDSEGGEDEEDEDDDHMDELSECGGSNSDDDDDDNDANAAAAAAATTTSTTAAADTDVINNPSPNDPDDDEETDDLLLFMPSPREGKQPQPPPPPYHNRIGTNTVKVTNGKTKNNTWGYTDSIPYHHLAFPIDPEEGSNTPVDERENWSCIMYSAHTPVDSDACRNQIYVRDCYVPYYQIATFLSTARLPRVECGFSQEDILRNLIQDTSTSSPPPRSAFRTSRDGQPAGDAFLPRNRRTRTEYLRRRSIRNNAQDAQQDYLLSTGGPLQHRE